MKKELTPEAKQHLKEYFEKRKGSCKKLQVLAQEIQLLEKEEETEEDEEECLHMDGLECGHCIDCGEYVDTWKNKL